MYIANTNINSNNSTTTINDMNEDYTQLDLKITKKSISMCFGCGTQINDQYILRVAPDLEWHAKCLKCVECGTFLDESCTCFVRNGKTYCKLDYVRLFSKKCFKCKNGFNKNDLVMRANNCIYHIDCFRCYMCNKQLTPGDEFAIKEDGLLCKFDNELYEKNLATSNPSAATNPTLPLNTNLSTVNINNSSILQTSSCQNITNLQPINSTLHTLNNSNKSILKCDDVNNNQNDYEDNQNCLSPNFNSQQNGTMQLTNLNNHNHMVQQQRITHLNHSLHQQSPQPIHMNQMNHHMLTSNKELTTNGNSNTKSSSNNNNNSSSNSSSTSSSSSGSSSSGGSSRSAGGGCVTSVIHTSGGGHHRKDKTTRVRTVLNEKQLHTLRTCYGANPRPDALMKEQLVEMTGLSPRVIRVWFQNKRCKDKKKTILIKQMQEQQKNRPTIGHGIPMVANSPVRNDMSVLGPGNQVEIQSSATAYQANSLSWKMSEFGMNGLNDMNNSIGHSISSPNSRQMHSGSGYDQMMNFGSDEEDLDQFSDQGGDDSVSSVGFDETRIQQL